MNKLTTAARKELVTIEGGTNNGDPCEAEAYHGFNGKDEEVVDKISPIGLFNKRCANTPRG